MIPRTTALALMALLVAPALSTAEVPTAPTAFAGFSAEIAHPHYPLVGGETLAWSGYGVLSGDLLLRTVEGVELVDGVQCRRVSDVYLSGVDIAFSEQCLAQDVDGNLWVVRAVDEFGQEVVAGVADAAILLWSDLVAGDLWTALAGGAGELLSLNTPLGRLRTGAGPYSDCLLTRETGADGSSVDTYYAPGVGAVRVLHRSADGSDGGLDLVLQQAVQAGPGELQFASATFSGMEEANRFPVRVVRTGGSEGLVWAIVSVIGGTAQFGSGQLNEEIAQGSRFLDSVVVYLAPGQTSASFDLVWEDDATWNHKLVLDIAIEEAGGGAALGPLVTAEVIVEESETGTAGERFIGPCFLEVLSFW